MKTIFSKSAVLLGIALAVSASTFAQKETKTKIEGDGYELKVKREKNELKIKQEGALPVAAPSVSQNESTSWKAGRTMTVVHPAKMPVAQAKTSAVAKKKTYASRKNCTCRTVAARKPAAKRSVAYRPKTRTISGSMAKTAAPLVLHDTVFITRVDTMVRVIEPAAFTGYSSPDSHMADDFKELKIKRENGEIELKKEYQDGRKVKKTFATEEDFNTYMQWKNY